jgi:hypothetical protein
MTPGAVGLAVAALLALAFAAAGELVLRRRSLGLAGLNEAFLVGAAVAAAALFPLSLAFGRWALRIELALLAASLAAGIGRRAARRGPAREARSPGGRDPLSLGLLAAVVAVGGCFVVLDLRYNLFWDGLLIWGSKAQVLFHEGFLGRAWYPDDLYELRHLTYPPLVPLNEALLSTIEGRFDFDALKPIFLPFFFSLPISAFAAVRAHGSRQLALATALAVTLLPPLVTRHSAGGYADMPEAAFVAGAVAAAFRRSDDGGRALPWLIGGLTTVKAEGAILATLASIAILAAWSFEGGDATPRRRRWAGAAIVAGFLALRLAYVRWLAVPDPVYLPLDAPHLREAVVRLPRVIRPCLVKTLSPRRWGLLWPAFAAGGAVLFVRGTTREKTLVAFVAANVVVLALPFLFTTWPLEVQIDQAYPRLLEQLAPAALVGIVLAYRRALGTETAVGYSPPTSPV